MRIELRVPELPNPSEPMGVDLKFPAELLKGVNQLCDKLDQVAATGFWLIVVLSIAVLVLIAERLFGGRKS
ncbi:MAG: hypothetical protein K2R98_08455 [Gemmataceae bacterium]|nr:hypothetical protein [Gemmataceae bacterium]